MDITKLEGFVSVPGFNETDPDSKFAIISNVWIKMMTFKKPGDFNPGHAHLFDHPTLLAQGSIEVEVDGVKTKFNAPAVIYIEKEKIHTITALEPNTVACCIHALRNGDSVEDIISEDMLPKGTNAERVIVNHSLTPLARAL